MYMTCTHSIYMYTYAITGLIISLMVRLMGNGFALLGQYSHKDERNELREISGNNVTCNE